MTYLSTHEELEALFGPPKAMVMAKTIDHLDPGACSWIAASAIMIASVAHRDDVEIVIGGGLSGWAGGDQTMLRLPVNCLDAADCLVPGSGFGSIFLVPSIRELMRVNGRVISNNGIEVSVAVDECYIHCGKALIRSEFWADVTAEPDLASLSAFAEHCRFLALATSDSDGYADLSPKGDPAGLMVKIEGNTLRFADRPGNKRIDSFRNIVDHPRIAAALIVPGMHKIAVVKGTARITDDLSERERLAVGDRVPDLATIVTDIDIELRDSAALARACAWPAPAPPAGLSAGRIASGHLKLAKWTATRQMLVIAAGPRIVGGQHRRHVAVAVVHLAQIGCARHDVVARIKRVCPETMAHPQPGPGGRHDLHQANRPGHRDGADIAVALDANDGPYPVFWDAEILRRLGDMAGIGMARHRPLRWRVLRQRGDGSSAQREQRQDREQRGRTERDGGMRRPLPERRDDRNCHRSTPVFARS